MKIRPSAAALLALALLATGCTSEDLVRLVNDCDDRHPIDESERTEFPRASFWEMSRER
jgi:type IV pilus biogenesis protein CpaD/CtpE